MELWIYLLILLVGIFTGFVNTLAGSGSLLTLPLLIFLGLPANVANGTNRVSILLQSLISVRGFHSRGLLRTEDSLILALSSSLGAVLGAQIAVGINEELMQKTIGAIMLLMLFLMFLNPKRWIEGRNEKKRSRIVEMIIFFLIGIYGGFIQAGVGIFILSALILYSGFDIIRANASKVLIVLIYTIPALSVFILNNQVVWDIGILLAIGGMIGADLGVRFSSRKEAGIWIHRLLILVVLFSALKLLGIFPV
ncbi:MAG: sulfite exporter TauE/SafE family protein [Archaeoglobi archaeon]|nr:sulfite exporter TauE/SafE family protein [Candidatus Mnemosynella sp.]